MGLNVLIQLAAVSDHPVKVGILIDHTDQLILSIKLNSFQFLRLQRSSTQGGKHGNKKQSGTF